MQSGVGGRNLLQCGAGCGNIFSAARRILSPQLILAALFTGAAVAQAGTITAVEPASIFKGDTVLLTITGEELPQGSVVVQFFPQQIAVLDILSSSQSELVVQVKVPRLAPSDSYNILIYNQLGDEAFGEGLLLVSSGVVTPTFRDWNPKVIAEAQNAFALLLSGEMIAENVANHLRMEWKLGAEELDGLDTTFSYGGPGKVLCAVEGDLPWGVLIGRIFLDDMPIYQVEVEMLGVPAMILGHAPARLDADDPPYGVRLLGTGFSARFLEQLEVEITSDNRATQPHMVELVDSASLRAEFTGPLPAGIYELSIHSGGKLV
ncbi:IPT/TIG domain-containing protein, partial [bacterium]|nr:IPT/TIG domain-containing protein [bacterium]